MQSAAQPAPVSKTRLWAGRIISALPVLMLLNSSYMKLTKHSFAVDGLAKFGYPESLLLGLGVLELACTVIYIIPHTSILGAILLTGYLGGAVTTHLRIGDPFSNVLIPVLLGALIWGGLYLRDERLPQHLRLAAQTASVSKKTLWAGIIISALPVLNLLFAGYLKLAKPAGSGVVEEFARLGYPESVILAIGILEIACTVVYLIPRTSVLGAILLTGYLGGAVATHVRVGDPSSKIIAPILVGALVWVGLYLRDKRLRALIPFRS